MAENPNPMTFSSGRVLEFEALRELLNAYSVSDLGKAKVAALQPVCDRAWIAGQHQLVIEVLQFLRGGGRFDFSGLLSPTSLLEKAHIAGVALETTEIRNLIVLIDRAAQWREVILRPPTAMKLEWAAVAQLSSGIADFTGLLRNFRNKILPDGTLDDRASPELGRIRREIEKQRRSIQESLRGYLRRLSEGGAVQEELITIRGERFVIPVKVEQKRRINGVIHGASSSGQTVFVEPLETIEQNNELVRLLEEELSEIHRILAEMTEQIGQRAAEIAAAASVLAELELQFTKARFAQDYECVVPTLVERGVFLEGARHPLLERNLKLRNNSVVPLNLELTDSARQIVITGPNTGGKTVGLKTVGLLALMCQSGMPVPAMRAQLPIFDSVLADIGDYQSIEQNLSTFSAHVTNIDLLSRTATAQSLVLLDELGSATDPEEGAALAVAIAQHFLELGSTSIISTHHTSLKVYGANTPGVVNAAVGFDERTLQPTYHLRIGVPGASAGINIAGRLGLNPAIIAAARARLNTQTEDIAHFLDQLHSGLRDLEAERAQLRSREQEVARERDRLERDGLREQRAKIQEMEKKLESVLRDFEYRAREVVSAVQDRAAAQKLSKESERRIAKLRREFKEQFDSTVVAHRTGADAGDPNSQPGLVHQVSEGDTVKLKSLGRAGVIKRRVDDHTFEVEVGAMKMKVPREDIAEVLSRTGDNPLQAARSRRGISVQVAQDEEESAASEINVIGENVEEATRRVEKFVDRAFLAGLPRVRIVHGSGMGILRKALRQYLQKHPHVTSVIEPAQKEGGAGATVVELRV
ncbi:MAG TPA: Smr/MutS family protein [Terriglobales bacterium]|nr:Smr/MutS family protein [Terriglobales bacterium]